MYKCLAAELDKRIAELDALIASGSYTDENAAKVSAIVDAARKVANNPESEKAVSDALKTLEKIEGCLLYTSDAADDGLCV